MKNKKGELTTEEIIKIILSVIGICLLLYLLFSLYGIFTYKTPVEQAKATLENIENKIINLEEGEEDKYVIEGPKNWFIYTYERDFPALCEGKNCLCACPEKNKEMCGEEGVCKSFEQEIHLVTAILDDNIDLKVIPREIFLRRGGETVKIYTLEGPVDIETKLESEKVLEDFLYSEISVNNQKLKIYEQMIQIVEKKSKIGVSETALEPINELNKKYGSSGWCIEYSKEGEQYVWNPIFITPCENKNLMGAAVEVKMSYNEGVLKVQFYTLRNLK
ncbi:MAG: hypothetical protein KKF68_03105 [Nanoarchaeota archaeon]|nr:hypothetical protein [Nanoarchaeota archaeon]